MYPIPSIYHLFTLSSLLCNVIASTLSSQLLLSKCLQISYVYINVCDMHFRTIEILLKALQQSRYEHAYSPSSINYCAI